jgi:hypothetical protein
MAPWPECSTRGGYAEAARIHQRVTMVALCKPPHVAPPRQARRRRHGGIDCVLHVPALVISIPVVDMDVTSSLLPARRPASMPTTAPPPNSLPMSGDG